MDTLNPSMIVLARESRGLKQVRLAKALGKSQAFLSQVENGKRMHQRGLWRSSQRCWTIPFLFL